MAGTAAGQEPADARPLEKGLKTGAISFASSVVIGVASTAPGYSLAAVLGLVVAVQGVGVQAPAIFIVAFIPMLLVAMAYKYLNKADPDAGTSFSWATRAFGPNTGWITGWAIVVADIIVMANLAQIAGLYSFLLFGIDDPSTLAVTVIGVLWIAVMTYVCVIGIELNAKTQQWLLTAEIVTLAIFAVVALTRVWAGTAPARSVNPELSWFSPFAIGSTSALTSGVLLAVFIYWGWDSLVCVNEETEDAENVPGKAAVVATLILLGIYVVVSTAAIAYGGPDKLANDDSRRRARHARQLGLRLRPARQDRDHRGALVGGRVDPDDDPADLAHGALDGAVEGLPAEVRPHPPAAPDPRHRDVVDGRPVDHLVRRPDARQRGHPVRLDRRARPDDRLLLRHDRLRLRLVLPPRPHQERPELLAGRRRPAGRRAHARRDLRQVLLRPGQGGRGVDDVLRPGLPARHRHRVPAARRRC